MELLASLNCPTTIGGAITQFADAGGNDVRTQFYHDANGNSIFTRVMWGTGSWRTWKINS